MQIELQLVPPSRPPGNSRPWMPHVALISAQLAHGISWLLLAIVHWGPQPGLSMPSLTWIHTVSLGWLTLTALSVLVHVIPGFFDVDWVAEDVARRSLAVYAAGVVSLVGGFWFITPWALGFGGTLIALGLTGFLIPATLTILRQHPEPGAKAPLKRGFALVFFSLATAATLGVIMAWTLAGAPWGSLLAVLPPMHAAIAGIGWLSLLIFGVSPRILFPVSGQPHRKMPLHWIASAAWTLSVPSLVIGYVPSTVSLPFLALGTVTFVLGALIYAWDASSLLWAAPNSHKPPIAFVSVAILYLLIGAGLAGGILLGHAEWQPALVFVLLTGWVAQSINGYLLHVGIRLLATMARGDNDGPRPGDLLSAPLSWVAFTAFQAAVLGGTLSLLTSQGPWLSLAGALGLVGWVTLMLNIRFAWVKAKRKA